MTNLASYIDHTLLRPDATQSDIMRLCEEANKNMFASVCVAGTWEQKARGLLIPEVKLCVVKNFPHGNDGSPYLSGSPWADEIDYVVNIGYIKSGFWPAVEQDFRTMYSAKNGDKNKVIKVIVEVGYLTDDELFKVADLLIEHKIDFIKTCTGYGPRNVTVDDIVKIKKHVGDSIKIKASGGIKTYEFAKQLIDAGADRLGTSSSISIIKGAEPSSSSGGY